MSHAIEVSELTKRFGRTVAVDRASFAVPTGAIFALLGPNGAGKTTALRAIVNVHRPTHGTARVLGVDSRRLGPAELRRIGYVSEGQMLPDWMRVGEFFEFCRRLYPTWDAALAERLRRDFGLEADTRLGTLSRGTRMKVALLSSIAYRPRLLVLDEPFSGLDPLVRDEVVRGVLEMAGQDGWTVLLSSHDIDEVERLADWVAVLDRGRVQLAEPTVTLQERFRRIDVALADPARMIDGPPSWMAVEREGARLVFVDSAYRAGESEAALRTRVGEDAQIDVTPLGLREIFVVLARTYRLAGQGVAA